MSVWVARSLLSMSLLFASFAGYTQKVFYSERMERYPREITEDPAQLLYRVYLVGDLKYPLSESANLQLLKSTLSLEGENSAVVILGDILYPMGLRDYSSKFFKEDTARLQNTLETFTGFKGEMIFLPGNHDWAKGGKEGLETVINTGQFIEEYFHRGDIFLPDDGCPGPVEVELTNDITLIVFDSQWYFHKYEKKGGDGACDFDEPSDIFVQIEDAIRRNKNRKVILATHHPLFSAGKHGGYFPASYLLFPLLDLKAWAYLPLPGFLYTGYRKYFGSIQDLAHPEYKIFRERLLEILLDYPDVIYAAGHEHNLQYLGTDSLHHIVSGGGGEGEYIARRKKKADFAFQSPGFSRLSFYNNGNVWMEFISPDGTASGKVSFRDKLFSKPVYDPARRDSILESLDFRDSTVIVKLSDIYQKGAFHRFIMGNNYRNIWNARVQLPVFDIGTEKGGLSIIKRGGGMQTRSIRMEDREGRQYVLRSVNKYVEKALAVNMRNTIAVDVLQDGISASHPFAAVTVPGLADAAGVMHTNPKYVWVPDDPRLGIYREEMANGVFLFEERPAGDRQDVESFGRSEKIVSTDKVIEKTQEEHDHLVDQKSVVRARIFDILINDWDRHDDQWRWARFEEDGNHIYRPIPRDRDQVFFVNEGVGMWVATRAYPMRKFQGFDYKVRDMKGLTFNARYFDRSFMSEPDHNDWMSITKEMQRNITDEVIHESIRSLPENIYDSTGAMIESKLKARRDHLNEYAEKFYNYLSKKVDVVGTDERDLFIVERRENGSTDVSVFALSDKKGRVKQQIYSREFIPDVTKEIRLYGLKGKDKFEVKGVGKKGIKVRIIGGKKDDTIIDRSKVRGLGKQTIVYDRKDKDNVIIKSRETRLRLSKDKSVNEYNRKQFKFNTYLPIVLVGYNVDDGVIVGGGTNINRYNFRDSSQHIIRGRVSFRTGAFSVSYQGLYTSVSRIFDLTLDAQISLPRNVDNFYGLGNETKKESDDAKYYRVRYEYAWFNPALRHTLNRNFHYAFGMFYQYFQVTDTADRYIGDSYPVFLDSSAYIAHHYTGLNFMFEFDTRNEEVLPKRGVFWQTNANGYYSIRDEGKNFIKFVSDLRFFLSFRKDPRVVFAFRVGGALNVGDFEFYHANFLGGKTNLRGFRSNRFAGAHTLYQNTEIRIKLVNIKSYVLNGQTGIYLFNDIGRVWVGGEDSKRWHDGYGAGVWLSPFNFAALTVAYNRSAEEGFITFSFRYLF